MEKACRVALVGDYNPSVVAHQAIPKALQLAGADLGVEVESVWTHTSTLHDPKNQFADFEGIWCVPASPYENSAGAVDAIRYARENDVPFFGSCGGFQYALIEYARNELGIKTADHAETNPNSDALLITPLSCSLVEQSEEISLAEKGIIREAYHQARISEGYHCNFGLNPAYEKQIFSGPLRPTAWGVSGEVRAMELTTHPFFVATLFQSERRALRGEAPPLVVAFVDAMN